MRQQKEFKKDMKIEMKRWGAEIDELKADMDKEDAQSRQSYNEEIKHLRALQYKAQAKLESFKDTGKESFNDIKQGVENAVKDLEQAVGNVLSRFKQTNTK